MSKNTNLRHRRPHADVDAAPQPSLDKSDKVEELHHAVPSEKLHMGASFIDSFWSVVIVLAVVRAFGAVYYTVISDCDQTFNYEEPTHYLLYGRGLQTWEYAPQYALRSYAYTGLHALIGLAVGAAWGADKISVFHRIHIVLALICAVAEAYFITGVAQRLSKRVASLTLLGLICSAGMLHVAPSYLPSTFTMCGLLFGWGAWMRNKLGLTIFATVTGLVLGWPFAVVAIVPMGLHILLTHNLLKIILHSVWVLLLVCAVCVATDLHYYHKLILAPWNIILYNAFGVGGGGQGSDLYGVEPASYYFRNLVLNFNVLWLLACLSPLTFLLRVVKQRDGRAAAWELAILSQLWIWFAIMTSRPHKEERFMFVVFPLIPLAAAVTVDYVLSLLARGSVAIGSSVTVVPRLFAALLFVTIACVSASRIVALVHGFGAPIAAWTALGRHLQGNGSGPIHTHLEIPGMYLTPNASRLITNPLVPRSEQRKPASTVRVCVGKEWYRFPSAFFLPDGSDTSNKQAEFAFIKSAFGGQLPQAYLSVNGSSAIRAGFNDENREEMDRYVEIDTCDYIVDFQLPTSRSEQDAHLEPYFDAMGSASCNGQTKPRCYWESIWSHPFVHAESSPSLARAFFIPKYSPQRNRYGLYHVLARHEC